MDVSKFIADYANEQTWTAMLLAGALLVVLAYLWLTARAVGVSKWWRIGYLPPLSLLYLLSGSRRVLAPLLLMLFGAGLVATPFLMTHYVQPLWRNPWEKTVDGELHVTLTGLTDFDYKSLQHRPPIAVLQMANPDVNDATLDFLADQSQIYELDLNDTQITDAGLAKLQSLPKLKTLRLKNTKVTDDGFKQFLAPRDELIELDVRETDIPGATLRNWKKAKAERKFLK